jgi:thiol-disulfide isomerase/thioredoxin
MRTGQRLLILSLGLAFYSLAGTAQSAPPPAVKQTMGFRPLHSDVEYDIPDPKTYDECKVNSVSEGKVSGWIVLGPAGQTLRRFLDTNGDNVVDMWCYYHNGLEVYRDIDSNFNNKIDQSRWLNTGGTRWAIDTNEDGRIDGWKMISAEEVSRVAIRALVTQDASLIAPLLITKDDLKALGLSGALETKLLASVADPQAKLRKAATGSKVIQAKTNWMRFDASPPGVIPAGQVGNTADIIVYENAMAIVDTGAGGNPGLVQIGELIKVGDIWKLTGFPQPLEGNNTELSAGLVMFHALSTGGNDAQPTLATGISEEVQKLVEELQELDKKAPAPNASKQVFERFHQERERILTELVNKSKTDEERTQWLRQLLDSLAAAVQSGNYPAGLSRLKAIEPEIRKAAPSSPLVPYAVYRVKAAEFTVALQQAADNDARTKVQDQWLTDLEEFIEKYPKSDDAPNAALQLAVANEFAGKLDKAKTWYGKLTSDYADAPDAPRAKGALQRLDLNGKPLTLAGAGLAGGTIDIRQLRGKKVLVLFWSTWCKPCNEDLPQLKALYEEYQAKGFEILGINLDVDKNVVGPYLTQNRVRWPQIYEPGGLDGPLAKSFGTMFFVESDGKVVNRSVSVADLKSALGGDAKAAAADASSKK